jgi:hypothetical protein
MNATLTPTQILLPLKLLAWSLVSNQVACIFNHMHYKMSSATIATYLIAFEAWKYFKLQVIVTIEKCNGPRQVVKPHFFHSVTYLPI